MRKPARASSGGLQTECVWTGAVTRGRVEGHFEGAELHFVREDRIGIAVGTKVTCTASTNQRMVQNAGISGTINGGAILPFESCGAS
jgi:hypothetical protein